MPGDHLPPSTESKFSLSLKFSYQCRIPFQNLASVWQRQRERNHGPLSRPAGYSQFSMHLLYPLTNAYQTKAAFAFRRMLGMKSTSIVANGEIQLAFGKFQHHFDTVRTRALDRIGDGFL